MSINFAELRTVLNSTDYPVFRDKSPKNTPFPYIVYSFVSESRKVVSGKTFKRMPYYQVSLFTTGTESDLAPIQKSFDESGVKYSPFNATQGSENDDTVTNFYTYVRVVENGR
ncbi:hypothetical protein ACH0F8_000562 [Enterococcus hirae]